MSALHDHDIEPCPIDVGDKVIWGSGGKAREYEITKINERENGDAEVRLMPERKRAGVPKNAIRMSRSDVRRRLRGESNFRRLD